MANEQSSAMSRDSMEKQKGLRISALEDDDEEENEQQQEEYAKDEFDEEEEDDDDDDDDDEEEKEFVILGFVEKPKTHWSLLRQLFPSKAGGVPVLISISFYRKLK
jgi:pre-rRNA-processing protein TSR4